VRAVLLLLLVLLLVLPLVLLLVLLLPLALTLTLPPKMGRFADGGVGRREGRHPRGGRAWLHCSARRC